MNSDFPIYFYIVPLAIFGPILFSVVWVFGLRDLFKGSWLPDTGEKRQEENEKKSARKGAKIRFRDFRRTALSPLGLIGQAIAYSAFAAMISSLTYGPAFQRYTPDKAFIKLSFSHPGRHKKKCRRRTRQELADLPPNMRAPMKCSRERWPVSVQIVMDGKTIFTGRAEPTGLSRGGASNFYEVFPIPIGPHRIVMRMKDGNDAEKYGFEGSINVDLPPYKIVVAGYDPINKKIILK
ncbi:MAG TPA: hypothetical protein ENI72_00400 [Rhodospirillales bacterium]|nr:hypothetical protein [Rhodospirillales bacterium]